MALSVPLPCNVRLQPGTDEAFVELTVLYPLAQANLRSVAMQLHATHPLPFHLSGLSVPEQLPNAQACLLEGHAARAVDLLAAAQLMLGVRGTGTQRGACSLDAYALQPP